MDVFRVLLLCGVQKFSCAIAIAICVSRVRIGQGIRLVAAAKISVNQLFQSAIASKLAVISEFMASET